MELSRFERVTWRINAIIILACGLLALVLMLIVGYRLFQDIFRTREVTSVVNVNPETKESEFLRLGGFSRISGTQLLASGLVASQDYRQSYYSKTGSSTRNYLFLDSTTKATHWLLDGNGSLILNDRELYADPATDSSRRTTTALLYEVVKQDSNGDSRLTTDDQLTVMLFTVASKRVVELLTVKGEVFGMEQLSSNEAMIFYRDDSSHYVATLDIAAAKIVLKTPLPAL